MTTRTGPQAVWDTILFFLVAAALFDAYGTPGPIVVLVLFGLTVAWRWVQHASALQDVDSTFDPGDDAAEPIDLVDPWALQRMLMDASGQEMPDAPCVNKGSLLYAALLMEESSETLSGLANAMRHHATDWEGIAAATSLESTANILLMDSQVLRRRLETSAPFSYELSRAEAKEIFDGTTDVAVVNCGLAIACGLDGTAGYAEVVGSNLSKRNPATGKIDKTPDGKWIKGADYRAPDLDRVLDETARHRAPDAHYETADHPV